MPKYQIVAGQSGLVVEVMLLRRSPVVSECLIVYGERSGRVLVASLAGYQPGKRNGGGRLRHGQVQGVAGLIAGVRWVGCRWWEDCQRSDEPFIPVIWQIECGWAAGRSVDCRVVFRRRVRYGESVQDMVLV